MTEWQEKRLADFVQINPIEKIKKGGIYKKISMEHIQPFCRDITGYEYSTFNGGSKFRNHDTVMARITPCLENGKCAQINVLNDNELGFGSTEFIVFRAITNVSDANFVYYLICSDVIRESAIKSMVGTSGRQRVQTNVLENLILSLPPLAVQKKIAGVLGALDDKIELNNKINQNLEAQAQALFKSWFIDFEPFGGKMPNDWKIGKLGDIADITSGKRPLFKSNIKTSNALIPIVGASGVMGYTKEYLYNNKILVTGRVGTHGIIQRFNKTCWPSDNTLIISSNFYEYVYNYLKIIDFSSMNRGSTQPLITQSDLKKCDIIIPSRLFLDKFEKNVSILFDLKDKNTQEIENLAELRDTLLPKLMNGEIDVDNVKID